MPSHQARRDPLPRDYQFPTRIGLSLRFIRDYDIETDLRPFRLDVYECPRCGVYQHVDGFCVNCLRGSSADATGEP